MAETIEAHDATCPVCQSGYRAHCHDRETAVEFAELREELARVTAERDRLGQRWCG